MLLFKCISMTVYYIISYDIHNMEMWQQYLPLAVPLINEHGGEVLAADLSATPIEGTPKQMNAIVKFPSAEAALACYNDPRYKEVMKLRIDASDNRLLVLAKGVS